MKELEDKIKQIKQKEDSPNNPERFDYSRLLVDLFSGLIVGASLGYFIDKSLGTLPLTLFLFTILGTAGGFYNFYKHLKKFEINKK
ncbi:AtpZ/AtpI family protein [Holosporaceae bacterium 'Namur']|nr:AtpZ/AtpI family protein [Holosporaceae bacterium 'Namur']